jgi:uncharacterized damage-inducible protein DinB
MDAIGFVYAAKMTNRLAIEIPENQWDKQLITELGTLRKLFIHLIRVRDTYTEGLRKGTVSFPGVIPSKDINIKDQLERSTNELAEEFSNTNREVIRMGGENLTILEFLNTTVQHEGIHQGQYFVALKQAGLPLPNQWINEWSM